MPVVLAAEELGNAIDVGVVVRLVVTQTYVEMEFPEVVAADGHDVAYGGLGSPAFALPSLVLAQADDVLVDIGSQADIEALVVGLGGTAEVEAAFELVVANLEELLLLPTLVEGTEEGGANREVTAAGQILQGDVPHGGEAEVGHVEEVVEEVGAQTEQGKMADAVLAECHRVGGYGRIGHRSNLGGRGDNRQQEHKQHAAKYQSFDS